MAKGLGKDRPSYPMDYRYAKRNVTEKQYDRIIGKISRLKADVRKLETEQKQLHAWFHRKD